ncbi:MAG: DinB family protein [Candidatus Bathyarchaeota archaeon]|nr:MAG: DinB family protein [Candidatus Bathyarchaeota archaeon]
MKALVDVGEKIYQSPMLYRADMAKKGKSIKKFAQIGFLRLDRATKDLTEDQLDWKSCAEANTIRRILTHLSQEIHVYMPGLLKGNLKYKPEGWPDDYVGNPAYSLEKIKSDLEKGKEKLLTTLAETSDEFLAEEMELFMGIKSRKFYVTFLVSEILHHEGQIAAILGLNKRMKD